MVLILQHPSTLGTLLYVALFYEYNCADPLFVQWRALWAAQCTQQNLVPAGGGNGSTLLSMVGGTPRNRSMEGGGEEGRWILEHDFD